MYSSRTKTKTKNQGIPSQRGFFIFSFSLPQSFVSSFYFTSVLVSDPPPPSSPSFFLSLPPSFATCLLDFYYSEPVLKYEPPSFWPLSTPPTPSFPFSFCQYWLSRDRRIIFFMKSSNKVVPLPRSSKEEPWGVHTCLQLLTHPSRAQQTMRTNKTNKQTGRQSNRQEQGH